MSPREYVHNLVSGMGGPVFMLDCASQALLILLIGVGVVKGRSLFSFVEMITLLAANQLRLAGLMELRVGFAMFLLAKLCSSTLVFFWDLYARYHNAALHPISYLLFPRSDYMHAGVNFGGKYYHFASPRGTVTPHAEIIDPVFELRPPVEPQAPRPAIERIVGVVFAIDGNDRKAVLQRLDVSGRCHDRAGVLVHVVSADNFMRQSLASWMRWLNWIGCIVLAPILLLHWDGARAVMQLFLICCAILESCKLRADHLQGNNQLKTPRRCGRCAVKDACKLLFHLCFSVVFAYCIPLDWQSLEFYVYMICTFAFSTLINSTLRQLFVLKSNTM